MLALLTVVETYWQVDTAVIAAALGTENSPSVWPLTIALAAVLILVGGTLLLMKAAVQAQTAGRYTSPDRLLHDTSSDGLLPAQWVRAWPLGSGTHRRTYIATCTGPVLTVLATVAAYADLAHNGNPSPLLYLPILNPLGAVTALLVVSALTWRGLALAVAEQTGSDSDCFYKRVAEARWSPMLTAIGVAFVTMEAARTVHHWLLVPWEFDQLINSTVLQASLSILWALIALSGMIVGRAHGSSVGVDGGSVFHGRRGRQTVLSGFKQPR